MWLTGQCRTTGAEHGAARALHEHGPRPAAEPRGRAAVPRAASHARVREQPRGQPEHLHGGRIPSHGDIGYIDDDGFVFVIDRAKELIKYKGHQVAPGELEDVLNHHPAIADCCCVRGRNDMGEEIPKAFVVLKNPDSPDRPTPQDIMDYMAENVAPLRRCARCSSSRPSPRTRPARCCGASSRSARTASTRRKMAADTERDEYAYCRLDVLSANEAYEPTTPFQGKNFESFVQFPSVHLRLAAVFLVVVRTSVIRRLVLWLLQRQQLTGPLLVNWLTLAQWRPWCPWRRGGPCCTTTGCTYTTRCCGAGGDCSRHDGRCRRRNSSRR